MINKIAFLNANITHTMVDGTHFTEEAESKHVLAVPAVFQGEDRVSSGRIEMTEFLLKLVPQCTAIVGFSGKVKCS